MKAFSNALLSNLETKLSEIKSFHENPVQYSEHGIKITIKAIEKLKSFFKEYKFENRFEEIEFFKTIKPEFASKLIYYNEIYNIEVAKPNGDEKTLKKYYKSQQLKMKDFYLENADFYKYYRTNNTSLDKKYFLRGKHDIKLTLDSSYFQSDYNFTTSHDYKLAKIKAIDNIQIFLETKIKKENTLPSAPSNTSDLKWTASKVALVELIYALNTEKVFNNGNITLNELAKTLEATFNIDLGQFNRSYLEIRNRKTIEKTHFLNTLKNKLVSRIEEADKK